MGRRALRLLFGEPCFHLAKAISERAKVWLFVQLAGFLQKIEKGNCQKFDNAVDTVGMKFLDVRHFMTAVESAESRRLHFYGELFQSVYYHTMYPVKLH